MDHVAIESGGAVDEDDILEGLTTHRSARFLGIWEGVVFDYEILDESLLTRDLKRIERKYRALGYYEAKVTAARITQVDDHRARVQIVVREGPPVVTDRISVEGVEGLPLEVAASAIRAVTIRAGKPFLEESYEASKRELHDILADNGYAFAEVSGKVAVELPSHRATVQFKVKPGPVSRYGVITLLGLKEIPSEPIRDTLLFKTGDRYNGSDLKDAENALAALGVFSKVQVAPDLRRPDTGTVPITVNVEETKLRTLTAGVGATADALRLALGARASWEDRNLLGGLRRLTIDTRPGLNFFPARIDNITGNVTPLPELKSQLQLRQPSFLEGRTTGFARGQFNIVPYLFVFDGDPNNADVLGFRELKFALGLERAFFQHHLLLTPSYNLDFRTPFVYGGTASNKDIVASYPEVAFTLDFRDNPLQPKKGLSLSLSAQANNELFAGSSDDLRFQPELRAFWPLSKRVVLAIRGTYGRLYALTQPADPATEQLLRLVRGFYSGGPGSNRGYPFRGVNQKEPLKVLTERITDPANGMLIPCSDPRAPRQACQAQPIGALEVWEASAEVRFPLLGSLSGVVFSDTSDVFQAGEDFSLRSPHLAVGPGLRYLTPVGPLRVDVGIRVPGVQEVPDNRSREQQPTDFLGIPAALHLSLGEDF
ncbi:MAG: POTRA domain-containing protein [Polyangiaceae bacterium]|nr:POTRA domain-containing protein [Polyangiaceae bacterium]